MDLKLFFSPIQEEIYQDITSVSSFYRNINIHGENLPDIKEHEIALIGLVDDRAAEKPGALSRAADEIRKKLYNLKRGNGRYHILDLGTLNNGVDVDETRKRIQEVGEYLISNNILPIFFGSSHDMDQGQFLAYQGLDKLVTFLNIDAFLDMEEESSPNQMHIQNILLHNPNYLFHYSHLAYQSFLIEAKMVEVLEKLYFETYRIGQLKTNIAEMEPVVRNADILSFDVGAIKSSDAPGSWQAQPFGLSGEEACQLTWYAGLNNKLSSAGFYEYDPAYDDPARKTASIVATMIWYFIEGFYNRKDLKDFKSKDYIKYVVSMNNDPENIVFYKSKMSEKWWLEVPYPEGQAKFRRNCIVPCSYADYETANKGEVPDRYVATHAKLI